MRAGQLDRGPLEVVALPDLAPDLVQALRISWSSKSLTTSNEDSPAIWFLCRTASWPEPLRSASLCHGAGWAVTRDVCA